MAADNTGKISFGLNLEEQAAQLISFLEGVACIPELHDPRVIARALYRYETFWLPLAATHSDECLSAPPDVEWVWYCHMLSPGPYRQDCMTIVKKVIQHTLVDQNHYKRNLSTSHKYWNQTYRNEPFYIYYGATHYPDRHSSKLTCNIQKEAETQETFLCKVSLPHFRDSKYLGRSLARYKKFLLLKSKFPDEVLVPSSDIVLIWSAHKLNPAAYEHDVKKLVPDDIDHENITNLRHDDKKVRKAFSETCKFWKDTFNESFPRPGAMTLGLSMNAKMSRLTGNDIYNMCTKETTVKLTRLTLYMPKHASGDEYKNLKIVATGCLATEEVCMWFAQKKILKGAGTTLVTFHAPTEELWFSTRTVTRIKFELERRLGRGCYSATETLGVTYYNILTPVESPSFMGGGTFTTKQSLASDIRMDVHGSFTPPKNGPARLFLDRGEFESTVDLDLLRETFYDIGKGSSCPDTSDGCQVATHRMINHAGKTIFTVTVTHAMPVLMSVIQIRHGEAVVATVHTVSSELLPLLSQVGENIPSFDPREGERAVIIKNSSGDWAVVKGHWLSQDSAVLTPGGNWLARAAGTLCVTVYNISTGQTETISLTNTADQYILSLDSVDAFLTEGVVELEDGAVNKVAEYVALTFAVSLLHVLLVPRPKGWRMGQKVMTGFNPEVHELEEQPDESDDQSEEAEDQPSPIILSDDMKFVLASGLQWNSPSNHYIREHYGMFAFSVYDRMEDASCHVDNFTNYFTDDTVNDHV